MFITLISDFSEEDQFPTVVFPSSYVDVASRTVAELIDLETFYGLGTTGAVRWFKVASTYTTEQRHARGPRAGIPDVSYQLPFRSLIVNVVEMWRWALCA